MGSGEKAGDVSLVKLRCEVSLMSTILIIPDKGEANSIIIASLLFHERMSVSSNEDTSVSVCRSSVGEVATLFARTLTLQECFYSHRFINPH